MKSNLPSEKPKLPAILTPENIEKACIAIRNSGKVGACDSILNANPSTILKWRKKFPEFGQRISEAIKDHGILMNTKHPELFNQAMASFKMYLQDREMIEVNETVISIFDEKTKEKIATKRTKKIRKYTREASLPAIEKVLGKTELKKALSNNTQHIDFKDNSNIIVRIFGNWIQQKELGKEFDGNLFNEIIDLMLLRTLQAETRVAREKGEISIRGIVS